MYFFIVKQNVNDPGNSPMTA